VDPEDEHDAERTSRPSAAARAQASLHDAAERGRRAAATARDRLREADARARSASSFVPAAETVVIDARRHPFLLVAAVVRTLAGLVVLATGLRLVPLLVLAAATAVWAQTRMKPSLRTTGLIAGGVAVGLAVLRVLLGTPLCVLLLLLWLAEDVADWYTDRLVVTDKRIYRRHGVVTRHSPSISLTAVAYIDAAIPPLGRLLRYGTLRLDSVAQRDAPLARFDLIPDVVPVSHEILRLRAAAMPRFPQQPL
jgi:hypothetical protein